MADPAPLPPLPPVEPSAQTAESAPLPPLPPLGATSPAAQFLGAAGVGVQPAVMPEPTAPVPSQLTAENGPNVMQSLFGGSPTAAIPGTQAAMPVAGVPVGGPVQVAAAPAFQAAAQELPPLTAPPEVDPLQAKEASERDAYAGLAHDQRKALHAESQAIDAATAIEVKKADAVATVQRQYQVTQDALQAEHVAKQKFYADAQTSAQKAVADAQDVAQKTVFDGDRLIKSMSGGETALTALSLVFGGIGAAFTHGPNVAAIMLQRRIDNDVDVQRENYGKLRQTVADKQTAYAQLRQQGFDDDQATTGAKMAATAQLQTSLGVIGATYQGPEATTKRDMLQAQLQEHAVALQTQLVDHTNAASDRIFAQRIAKQNADADTLKSNAAMEAAGRGRPPNALEVHRGEMSDLTLPGWQGHAKTSEAYTKAVVGEQGYQALIPMLDKLIAMREKYGREVYDREAIAEASATAISAQLQAKNVDGLGALSGPDMGLLEKKIPTDIFSVTTNDSTIIARLKAVKKAATIARDTGLRVLGYNSPDGGGAAGADGGGSDRAPTEKDD